MSEGTPRTTVTPLAGSIGVRIDGIELARDATEQLAEALRTILDRHLVIHLPGQAELMPDQHREFAALWGEVVDHPSEASVTGYPGVVEVSAPRAGTDWHHDVPHLTFPPSLSIVMARDVPSSGGDTMWANQYAAYDHFSAGLRETLGGLYGVHEGRVHTEGEVLDEQVSSVHPAVITHDRTERRALFVDPSRTVRFDGWTVEESAPLLEYVRRAAVRNELTCRHRWSVGDVVIWDNRATLVCDVGDVDSGEKRTLHRVAIAGLLPH